MYDEKYKGYIKPRIGSLRLKDVKDVHLQGILNEHAGKSLSHLQKLRRVMRELFSRARKSRLIPYDPSEDLVAKDLTPYCLRHTFCTDLERAGVPINVAKDLMGHSDIAVTANIYTHRDKGVMRASIALLDGSSRPYDAISDAQNP